MIKPKHHGLPFSLLIAIGVHLLVLAGISALFPAEQDPPGDWPIYPWNPPPPPPPPPPPRDEPLKEIPSPALPQWEYVCILRDWLSPRIKQFGGDPELVLPSIEHASAKLRKSQGPEGSWGHERDTCLALAAVMTCPQFLGNGEGRDAVLRAVEKVLKDPAVDPETQAIRTWVLCQAYGWFANYSWEDPILDSTRSLLKAQRGDGGFTLSATDPSDTHQTLVSIEALTAAQTLWPHESGLADALRKAQSFIAKAAPEKEVVWGLRGYLRARKAFLQGGDAWAQWQRSGEAEILRTQQKDGLWEAAPGESRLETSAFAMLCLGLYFEVLPEVRHEKKNETPRRFVPEEEIKL